MGKRERITYSFLSFAMIEPNKQSFQADFFRGLGIDNIQRPYFHVVKKQDIITRKIYRAKNIAL